MSVLVGPVGPRKNPVLALIGEAPGKEEVSAGIPFVGSSGRLLTQMLTAAGINRSQCYITNVMQERPPGNDFKHFYVDASRKEPTKSLVAGWKRLEAELKEVRPKVIVALGREPLYALVNEPRITDFRGTMVERYGYRIIPTYHPAYILRAYNLRPIVETDLRKALRQAINPSKPTVSFNVNPEFHEVIRMLRQRPKRIAVDIETFGNPPMTRCVGIAWSKHEAMCVPLVVDGDHRWTLDEETEILHNLNGLLNSDHVEKTLQNCPFDVSVLEREFGISISPVTIDTMFAFHTLYPELAGTVGEDNVEARRQGRKGLDFLSSLFTDFPMYWDYKANKDEETFYYNCMDCVVTFEVAGKLEAELRERHLWDFYTKHIQPAVGATTRMGHRGVRINVDARDALKMQTEWEMANVLKGLKESFGPEFNPSSPKQVQDIVYSQWRLPEQRNPATKRVTTDDDALVILATNHPEYAEPLGKIIEYRRKQTLLGNFLEAKLKNGRIYTSFNTAGTVTGRLSSRQTIEGIGGNLQNIPRGEYRRIYQADPGKVIIKSDLEQAEYRVLVWKAKIDRLIEKLTNDPTFSIHRWNAAENIFHVPYDQVTKEMYANAKNGVYGANYGIGPLKISRMYNMPFQLAKMIIENYHKNVPEVQGVFQREIREHVKVHRRLINPLGRERTFYGRMDDQLFRAAYSWYCQSTVADIITDALIQLDALGIEVLLQVHDELVVQCSESEIDKTTSAIRSAMERPVLVDLHTPPLIIPTKIKVGPNWFDTKEI